ncbi:MAG: MFS transporter [Nocardioidaceae bacterium]|nr:MFS transporter [Nocardioidaceae bacterium]
MTTAGNGQQQGLILGLLMATTALGISAPAVALPALAGVLDRPVAALAWVLAAYALALALATAVAGRLVDLYGAHRTLWFGVAAAVLGTTISVAAPTLSTVVAGRLIQGAGAGAIAVVVLTVATLRPADSRGAVLGTMTATVAVLSGAGPLLGGALAVWSPRAALALPALALLVAGPALRGVPRVAGRGRVDLIGAGLLAITVGSLTLLVQARTTELSPVMAAATAAASLLAGAALVRHTRRHRDGFLPHEVVGRPVFGLVAGSGATVMAAYLATLFAAPVLLAAQGLGPFATGAVLLPAAVVGAASSRLMGRLVQRMPPLTAQMGIAALAASGLLTGALAGASIVGVVLAAAMVLAAFAGGQVAVVSAMSALTTEATRGIALGLQNLALLTGGALGTAAAGALTDLATTQLALAVLVPVPLVGVLLARTASAQADTDRTADGVGQRGSAAS